MEVLREILAIALVFALLWGALWLLKTRPGRGVFLRSHGSRGAELIELRGRLALSPRHSLHVVRFGDRQMLIGVHPEGFTVIGDCATAGLEGERSSS